MTVRSVQVPFAYTAWVTTSKRESVQRTYREEHEAVLSVHEEVEPVLVWRDTQGHAREVRVVDGVVLDRVALGGGHTARTDREDFDSDLVTSLSHSVPEVLLATQVKLKGPPRPETVETSRRDEAVESVSSACDRLVIVGGQLHRRGPSPVLLAGEGWVRIMSTIEYGRQHLYFTLDRMDDAAERAAILGGIPISQVRLPEMRMRDRDWLDQEIDLAFRAGANWIMQTTGRWLHLLPIEGMEAFCDARDSLERRAEQEDRAEALEALARLMPCLSKSPLSSADREHARHIVHVEQQRLQAREPLLSPAMGR